jgi:hypothetical protein
MSQRYRQRLTGCPSSCTSRLADPNCCNLIVGLSIAQRDRNAKQFLEFQNLIRQLIIIIQQKFQTLRLDDLIDVTITLPTDGDVLTFQGGIWVNLPPPSGNTYTASNVGFGAEVFKQLVGTNFEFRTITNGPGIIVTENADDINIANGGVITASNLGSGSQVLFGIVGNDLRLRTLTAGTGISLIQNANDIVINSTNSGGTITNGNNLGAGEGVFANVAPPNIMNFRSLVAGSGITLLGAPNTITISSNVTNVETNTFTTQVTGTNRIAVNAGTLNGVYIKVGGIYTSFSGTFTTTINPPTNTNPTATFVASFLTNNWSGQPIHSSSGTVRTSSIPLSMALAGTSICTPNSGTKNVTISLPATGNGTYIIDVNFIANIV